MSEENFGIVLVPFSCTLGGAAERLRCRGRGAHHVRGRGATAWAQ